MSEVTETARTSALAADLAAALGPWFEAGHRDLSWRRTSDPYAIWVSEIMLQQTRVETVERYYSDFLARFPSVEALAEADEAEVLGAWSGLGYYRRARLLHKGARHVRDRHASVVPSDGASLLAVPGVGRYTAGAIASIAFDRPQPLVDGNVARVLSRVRAATDPTQQGAGAKGHWTLAAAILERGRPRILAQALMELGATVCTPRRPKCDLCPVQHRCRAFEIGQTDVIPAPKKRAKQPVDQLRAIAIVARKRLLLVERPAEGLLGGMWCLPLLPAKSWRAALGSVLAEPEDVPTWLRAGAVRHVFTHRIWEVEVLEAQVPRRPELVLDCETTWVAPGERPRGGIPKVTDKLARAAGF